MVRHPRTWDLRLRRYPHRLGASSVCPWLVSMGIIALLLERGFLSEPRALALLPLTTVALVLTVLSHIRLHGAVTLTLSLIAGVVTAPIIGVSLLSAFSSGLAAIGLGLTVLVLALVTAAVSTVGVAYAFTGSFWFPDGPDSTIAMGQGITISLLGSIPLLAAVGLLLLGRSSAS